MRRASPFRLLHVTKHIRHEQLVFTTACAGLPSPWRDVVGARCHSSWVMISCRTGSQFPVDRWLPGSIPNGSQWNWKLLSIRRATGAIVSKNVLRPFPLRCNPFPRETIALPPFRRLPEPVHSPWLWFGFRFHIKMARISNYPCFTLRRSSERWERKPEDL